MLVDDPGLLAGGLGHGLLDGRHQLRGESLRLLSERPVGQLDVLDRASGPGHDGHAAIGVRRGRFDGRDLALHSSHVRELIVDLLHLRLESLELRDQSFELR